MPPNGNETSIIARVRRSLNRRGDETIAIQLIELALANALARRFPRGDN